MSSPGFFTNELVVRRVALPKMAAAAGGTGEDPVSNNGPIAPGQSGEGAPTDAAAADINRGRIICLKMFLLKTF